MTRQIEERPVLKKTYDRIMDMSNSDIWNVTFDYAVSYKHTFSFLQPFK